MIRKAAQSQTLGAYDTKRNAMRKGRAWRLAWVGKAELTVHEHRKQEVAVAMRNQGTPASRQKLTVSEPSSQICRQSLE
jgi:hypothetical protein